MAYFERCPQHGQIGRLWGGTADHHGLLRLRLKAWGCLPHLGGEAQRLSSYGKAVALEPAWGRKKRRPAWRRHSGPPRPPRAASGRPGATPRTRELQASRAPQVPPSGRVAQEPRRAQARLSRCVVCGHHTTAGTPRRPWSRASRRPPARAAAARASCCLAPKPGEEDEAGHGGVPPPRLASQPGGALQAADRPRMALKPGAAVAPSLPLRVPPGGGYVWPKRAPPRFPPQAPTCTAAALGHVSRSEGSRRWLLLRSRAPLAARQHGQSVPSL